MIDLCIYLSFPDTGSSRIKSSRFRVVIVLTPYSLLMTFLTVGLALLLASLTFFSKPPASSALDDGVGRLPCMSITFIVPLLADFQPHRSPIPKSWATTVRPWHFLFLPSQNSRHFPQTSMERLSRMYTWTTSFPIKSCCNSILYMITVRHKRNHHPRNREVHEIPWSRGSCFPQAITRISYISKHRTSGTRIWISTTVMQSWTVVLTVISSHVRVSIPNPYIWSISLIP